MRLRILLKLLISLCVTSNSFAAAEAVKDSEKDPSVVSIEKAADDGDKNALLLIASHNFQIEEVERLLKEADVLVNFQDSAGNTALVWLLNPFGLISDDIYHWDIRKVFDIIEILIDAGANPNLLNKKGESALSIVRKRSNSSQDFERILRQIRGAFSLRLYKDAIKIYLPTGPAELVFLYERRIPRSIFRFADQTSTQWQLAEALAAPISD